MCVYIEGKVTCAGIILIPVDPWKSVILPIELVYYIVNKISNIKHMKPVTDCGSRRYENLNPFMMTTALIHWLKDVIFYH